MDKISVIIPAYNAEKTIKKCINSIQIGRGRNSVYELEIIVVNDGSSDRTLAIVEELAKEDKDIRVISQKNRGVSGSRSAGLRNATGKYIAWCDSDDSVKEDWLKNLYKHLIDYNADISICRAYKENIKYNPNEITVWNNDEAIGKFIEHKELNGCLWNKLIKSKLFKDIDFCLEMRYWEDFFVVWQIIKSVKRVVRCNEGTYNYYVNPNSLCNIKITENKLWCSQKVWNIVVDDCSKEPYKHYLQAAKTKRIAWLISDVRRIIHSNDLFLEHELSIQKVVRESGVKCILSQNGLKNKFTALCIAINIPLTHKIFGILYRIKRNHTIDN